MSKQKTIWRSIGIPLALFKQVLKLIHYTGDPSVAERVISFVGHTRSVAQFHCAPLQYVRIAVRQRINRDESRLDDEV